MKYEEREMKYKFEIGELVQWDQIEYFPNHKGVITKVIPLENRVIVYWFNEGFSRPISGNGRLQMLARVKDGDL